jgi:RNA polymerase sigma-70 factor (ECF subfamily)
LGDSSKQTVDDIIQDTYLKLCANGFRLLREFDHRHPNAFVGLLQAVATNLARDHFKKRRKSEKVEPMPEGFVEPSSDLSPGSAPMMERKLLIQEVGRQVDDCVKGPDQDRNRRVFWLRHHAGLTVAHIARLPGIGLTDSGVESLISRILKCLRERINAEKPKRPDTRNSDEGILPAESF